MKDCLQNLKQGLTFSLSHLIVPYEFFNFSTLDKSQTYMTICIML